MFKFSGALDLLCSHVCFDLTHLHDNSTYFFHKNPFKALSLVPGLPLFIFSTVFHLYFLNVFIVYLCLLASSELVIELVIHVWTHMREVVVFVQFRIKGKYLIVQPNQLIFRNNKKNNYNSTGCSMMTFSNNNMQHCL